MKRLFNTLIIALFFVAIGTIGNRYNIISYQQYGLLIGVMFGMVLMYGLWRRRRLLYSPFKRIDKMSGERFEEYLMVQFKRKGYRVRLTPTSGDFGADLIMKRWRRQYVVQAKRYSGAVGIKAVQEVIGAMQYYEIENGMVVTNSYYTKAARQLAQASGVTLWDRSDIEEEFNITR